MKSLKAKTTWEYSPETEAKRVLQCAHQMANGFYRVNNFYVLPMRSASATPATVTFPDLEYITIPRFWDKARKLNIIDLPYDVDQQLLADIKNLLTSANIAKPKYKHTQKAWAKAEKAVISEIEKLIPSVRGKIKQITIYPTVLGTGSSFNYAKDGHIQLFLREDHGIYTITEAILTSLTRKGVYELDGTWSESEMLVDWLLTSSSISEVLKRYDPDPNFLPTLKGTRIKQKANLLATSEAFYTKLGLPSHSNIFHLNGRTPEVHNKPLRNLTAQERQLLRILIEHEDSVVTFDDIADIIFPSEDSFSLYAIAKSVQRLRNKLEENGISGSYIQTLRGKGYLLKN